MSLSDFVRAFPIRHRKKAREAKEIFLYFAEHKLGDMMFSFAGQKKKAVLSFLESNGNSNNEKKEAAKKLLASTLNSIENNGIDSSLVLKELIEEEMKNGKISFDDDDDGEGWKELVK